MAGTGENTHERGGAGKPFFSGSSDEVTGSYGAGAIGPGAQVGPFKLLGILGEGGYGIVYLAEQEQPLRRRVALKVIKPGMDSHQIVARFEAERQALALLDHPHIAHVHDAGTTPEGRPYFAMEYIEGLPVTEYCDREKLTIKERLRLFLQVCEAVKHAHQKGIIHRDLKPSNMLVTAQSDKPLVKVIDFGIAKALAQPLTDKTLYTEQGQFIGTPDYMSPEQAEMDARGVDTRSDVYSLGVVLYELLTGVLPFDPDALRAGGIEHVRATIREQEPRTPSTRLTSLGVETKKIAERRQTDPQTLARSLRRELEWIPLKAMRKETSRRYQSVSELADDIENYLESRPLLAGPESLGYRTKKFIRRHSMPIAAAGVVLATLILGLGISTVSLVREQHARRVAVAAQEKEADLRRQVQTQAYASDMSLAQQALAMNDVGRARRLLEAHRPDPGEVDRRGWEWRYLWQECRTDALDELCRYPDSAFSVAYSPDGKVLAVGGFTQGFVEIWDVTSRKRLATLDAEQGRRVAFSPRQDLLATDAEGQIRLWRTSTRDCVHRLPLAGSVRYLKFSRDGARLAGLSYPDEATVWQVDQWSVVRRIRGVRNIGPDLGSLDFSPDGQRLIVGDLDHRLRAIDLASGDTIFDIPEAHPEPITRVAWSPDGSVIVSGSGYTGGPLRLWDAADGRPLGVLEGHTAWISQLLFSTDGRRLYSASADQTIRIWHVEQRRCLATLRGSSDEVWGLALSPDGMTLASTCKDGVIALWNAVPQPQEESPRQIQVDRSCVPMFSPDSRVLAVRRKGTVSLLDAATFEEIERLAELGTDAGRITYSADGTLLAAGDLTGKVRVWSCGEHRLVCELSDANGTVSLLHFRNDGSGLLSIDEAGRAIWWDLLTRRVVRSFAIGPPQSVAVSADGHRLLVGDVGAVRWLNPDTGELLATTNGGHRHKVWGVAFSDDGTQAASVALDGTVAIWNSSSFQLIAAFKGHMQGAHAVAFSPDGRRLATSGNGRDAVKLWDLSTFRELTMLPGQGFVFGSTAFSRDGRWLTACGNEGELNLWRTPLWEEIEAAEKRGP
ncbi:MAG: serine/threonine protein kinase, partial [Planctomycetes bacterium]|nr:serine/threonine protein kinase [Planctomycetota bacterium]